MECKKHKGNEILYVCARCNYDLVCSKCLIESHNGHRMNSCEEARNSIKEQLQKKISDNAVSVFDLMTQLQGLSEARKEQNQAAEQIKKEIQERQTKLHKLVDKAAIQLLSECEMLRCKNCESLDKQSLELDKQKSDLKQLGAHMKEIFNIQESIAMIQLFCKLEAPTIKKSPCQLPNQPHYTQMPVTMHNIINQYGSLLNISSSNPKQEICSNPVANSEARETFRDTTYGNSDFIGFTENIISQKSEIQLYPPKAVSVIAPNNNSRCWVKCFGDSNIILIDDRGEIHQNVKCKSRKVNGFTVSKDGYLYTCSLGPNCIQKLNIDQGNLKILFSTREMLPQDIRCTSTGELLVTLIDDDTHDLNPMSKRLIVKYNESGQELAIIERDRFNDRIFIGPTKVRVSPSQDIVVVVNEVSHELCYLVVLDWQLNVKLRYLGHQRVIPGNQRFQTPKPGYPFYLFDAAFDKLTGNIVVCEEFSKSMLLLSPTCLVLKTLFVDNAIIWTLAITDDKTFWIGREDGKIKVLVPGKKDKNIRSVQD